MSWHVTAARPDGHHGRGYLSGDLHPQDGQRLVLTGIPARAYVFEDEEQAKGLASLANLPATEVVEGRPAGELECPSMLVIPPSGNRIGTGSTPAGVGPVLQFFYLEQVDWASVSFGPEWALPGVKMRRFGPKGTRFRQEDNPKHFTFEELSHGLFL